MPDFAAESRRSEVCKKEQSQGYLRKAHRLRLTLVSVPLPISFFALRSSLTSSFRSLASFISISICLLSSRICHTTKPVSITLVCQAIEVCGILTAFEAEYFSAPVSIPFDFESEFPLSSGRPPKPAYRFVVRIRRL